MTFVLAVDLSATAVIVATASVAPIRGKHLLLFALLAALSAGHLEFNRRVERMRELANEGTTFTNFTAIWTFAGLLLLPPPLVAALIALAYIHMWLRLSAHAVAHRWVFTASTVVLASAGAGAILAAVYPATYPDFPASVPGMGVVVVAALARWSINSVLVYVVTAIETTWRNAFRNVFQSPTDELLEYCALSLGILVAAALTFYPVLLVALTVPLVAVHRGVLLSQFEHAAQRDAETGALRMELWHQLATKQLERAARLQTTVGYLLIRLDKIDPAVAMPAEDRIGRLVADAIRSALRESDLVGRLPGATDFAVLIPDVRDEDLSKIAERIRAAIRRIRTTACETYSELTVCIGGASFPTTAWTLAELMLAADNALFLATSYVRDEIRIAGPDTL